MGELNAWIQPLLLLPGVGLLILGTAQRSNQLNSEYHFLTDSAPAGRAEVVRTLLKRASLFRNALVSLYGAAALLALSALAGSVTLKIDPDVGQVVGLVLGAFAVAGIVFAAVELMRESVISSHMIKERCAQLSARGSG